MIRLPISKAIELLKDYQETVGFKDFYEQQRVSDILAHKETIQRQIKEEVFQEV